VTQLNILIVEDNVHFRTLIRSILQALGVSNLEEARDGLEALEMLGDPTNTMVVDLVILDWKMDGMNGVDCVRQIRRLTSDKRAVPIIMVTGYTETSLQNEARAAGVDDFLGKPISPQSLLNRIVSVMEAPRPMVDVDSYFGPDRRVAKLTFKGPNQRKD